MNIKPQTVRFSPLPSLAPASSRWLAACVAVALPFLAVAAVAAEIAVVGVSPGYSHWGMPIVLSGSGDYYAAETGERVVYESWYGLAGSWVFWTAGNDMLIPIRQPGSRTTKFYNNTQDNWVRTGVRRTAPRREPVPSPDTDGKEDDTKEPISTISGAMHFDATDIVIPCPGVPLDFSRLYNSQMAREAGPLGANWSHSLEWSLSFSTNIAELYLDGPLSTGNYAVVSTGGGLTVGLTEIGTNYWQSHRDTNWRMQKSESGGYILEMPPSLTCSFDASRRLRMISDRFSNTVTLAYTNIGSKAYVLRAAHTNGQYIALEYSSNQVVKVSTPLSGLDVSLAYDSEGNLTNVVRRAGTTTQQLSYQYSDVGILTNQVDQNGAYFGYAYSGGTNTQYCTNMVAVSGFFHHSVDYYTNDARTVVTYYRGSQELPEVHHYDDEMRVLTSIEENGSPGQVRALERHPDTVAVTKRIVRTPTSDYWLEQWQLSDIYHNVTNLGVGFCGPPTNLWVSTYDTNLQVATSITDPMQRETRFEYTNAAVCRIQVMFDATNTQDTVFAYTSEGLLASVTNVNGNWVRYGYDEFGFPSNTTPRLGPAVDYRYSRLGHLEEIRVPGASGPRATTFDVNEFGWVQEIKYPDLLSDRMFYDNKGNVTSMVDRAGQVTEMAYLPTDRLSSVTRVSVDGTNRITQFSYDNQFNLRSVIDARGRVAEGYTLDGLSRVVSVTNIEGQVSRIDYYVGDMVAEVERFDGSTVSNVYDRNGWVVTQYIGDVTNTFDYFDDGQVRAASNAVGTLSFAYDSIGRVSDAESVGPTGRVSYLCYPGGQASNIVSVAGVQTRHLDGAERAASCGHVRGTKRSADIAFAYNEYNGLLSSMSETGGLAAAYSYDVMDRLTSITWTHAAGPSTNVLLSFVYSYDNADMITNVVVNGTQSMSYAYDSFGQLVQEVTAAGAVIAHEYDLVGNRMTRSQGDATVNYALGVGNRLAGWDALSQSGFEGHRRVDVVGSSSEPIGLNPAFGTLWISNAVAVVPEVSGSTFAYTNLSLAWGQSSLVVAICDEAGNTTYVTNSCTVGVATNAFYSYADSGAVTSIVVSGLGYSRAAELAWDSSYHLTSVVTNESTAETYAYDAFGRRAYTASGGATNWYVYDGDHVLAEVDNTGELIRSYVWGPGIDNLLAFTDYTGGETNTYYALTDHLGTVHAMVDESGEIVESYRYDAWGRVLGVYDATGTPLDESAIGNHYLWQGRWYSWDTKLYYFRARWYDPITGRWLSKDPIGISGGLNQYVFCGNNPVNFRDPDGHWGIPALTTAQIVLRKRHWNRNSLNQQYENEADARLNWGNPLPKWQSTTHQIGAGNEHNVKYVSPDGRHEAVYKNGKLVTDPLNQGTFNVFGPDKAVRHGVFDVIPWILWGNTPGDPSSPAGRINTLREGLRAKKEATCTE